LTHLLPSIKGKVVLSVLLSIFLPFRVSKSKFWRGSCGKLTGNFLFIFPFGEKPLQICWHFKLALIESIWAGDLICLFVTWSLFYFWTFRWVNQALHQSVNQLSGLECVGLPRTSHPDKDKWSEKCGKSLKVTGPQPL